MTDKEFGELLSSAMEQLQERQQRLEDTYGIGRLPRWWFDQEKEQLQFLDDAGNALLEAAVIPIGSHAPQSDSWKWSWSNESILPSLREKAMPLKQLEATTGFELFSFEEAFEADEYMAWELAALSVMHLKAEGCYRAPSSNNGSHTFLAITSLRKVLR